MGQQLDIMRFKLNQPALIEASAGTGKTYTITNLVLRILLGSGDQKNALDRPLLIEDLLIVTFTNVATADLRRRIYERIRMAHVLFDNFLEYVSQELLNKINLAASKEFKKLHGGSTQDEDYQTQLNEFCESFLADDLMSQQLHDQLINAKLDVEKIAREKLGCKDDFLIQLLKQTADKDALKEAISVLTRAERSIDNAAICTIHSFCNRTLNQIYAFEANEVFTTELSADLSDEETVAANTVWRQQFYKLNASPTVLRLLDLQNPYELNNVRRTLNSVKLSRDDAGVFGYQLLNFKIPGCDAELDLSQDFSVTDLLQRLFYQVDIQSCDECAQLYAAYAKWRNTYGMQAIEPYINVKSESLGPYFIQHKKKGFNKSGQTFVHGLKLLEEAFQEISSDPKLQQTLQESTQIIESAYQASGGHRRPLTCEQAQRVLTKLKQLKLDETLGDVGAALQEASQFLDDSGIKSKTTHVVDARGKSFLTDEYFAFLDKLIELVQALGAIKGRQDKLKPVLYTLLGMQINLQLQEQCAEHHVMSNDDLLLRLDQALQRPGFGERLAKLIRMRYPLAMIDEFQDTDPIQYSIFSRIYLNEEALKDKAYCYLIGDPKQSIYAFRGSDINSYLKARHQIKRLTKNKGLSTLGVNYRSTEDVIKACNALFGNQLNPDNVSPFKERDIPFQAVGVSKKRKSQPDGDVSELPVDSMAMAQAWGASFVIENLQQDGLLFEYNASEDAEAAAEPTSTESVSAEPISAEPSLAKQPTSANAKAEAQLRQALANTYVVSYQKDDIGSVSQLRSVYAESAAYLIKKVLENGKIIDKGQVRAVKPSDIAILVRSANENDYVQSALQKLGLSSVYFSDRSSVLLQDNGAPTKESLDLLYLMEAMCDHSNRSKVMRILGSGLLCLHASEFLEHIKEQNFEREVKVLRDCAQVWNKYGFMPAFMQWCNAPEHQVSARLLSIINGERILTNYNQIAELIQSAHNQHAGIQSQLRWFYDTLYSSNKSFDSEATQKRLESEHEQIKILTIHKSKGLEFPIVFMPFLWYVLSNKTAAPGQQKSLDTAKYYSYKAKHMVVDYDNQQQLWVPNVTAMALEQAQAQKQGQEEPYTEFFDADNENWEQQVEEQMALEQAEAEAAASAAAEGVDASSAEVAQVAADEAATGAEGDAVANPKRKLRFSRFTPKEFERYENAKELTRLLYVAVTRARLANFFFMGEYKAKSGSASALMELFGVSSGSGELNKALDPLSQNPQLFTLLNGDACLQHYQECVESRHTEAYNLMLSGASPVNQKRETELKAKIEQLLEQAISEGQHLAKQHPEAVTWVGGVPLEKKLSAKIHVLRQELQLLQVSNVPLQPSDMQERGAQALTPNASSVGELSDKESCAMSFVYKGAIDSSFNIMSYSKLTSGKDPVKKALSGQRPAKRDENEDGSMDVQGAALEDPVYLSTDHRLQIQEPSDWLGKLTDTGLGSLVGGNLYTDNQREVQHKFKLLQDPRSSSQQLVTLNDFVQTGWDAGKYVDSQCLWQDRPLPLCFNFPRGAEPGTFMHEVLRMIDFSKIQSSEQHKIDLLGRDLIEQINSRNDLSNVYKQSKINEGFLPLWDWLIDIVEAPIIQGHKQCLALADLQPHSFVPEMNFLMTSQRFNTKDIDGLCQEMARHLLPKSMHEEIIENLELKPDEIFGFITGSLDVACRFDLNYQGNLNYRPDLFDYGFHTQVQRFKGLYQEYLQLKGEQPELGQAQIFHPEGFLNEALEQHIAVAQDAALEFASDDPDEKYYVIDYKTNILGEKYSDYSTNNMLKAIYQHRYDVQFLFYTLALYRFLKRRKGVDPNADYETLRAFYDKHVGGVIYMYLRGLKADFLRRKISTGVFSAKIDFEFVARLDEIFGAEEQWEA